jgi:hypothetical protein
MGWDMMFQRGATQGRYEQAGICEPHNWQWPLSNFSVAYDPERINMAVHKAAVTLRNAAPRDAQPANYR